MEAKMNIGRTTVDILGITEEDARELATLLIDVAPFEDAGSDTAFRRIHRALAKAGVNAYDNVTYHHNGVVTVRRAPL